MKINCRTIVLVFLLVQFFGSYAQDNSVYVRVRLLRTVSTEDFKGPGNNEFRWLFWLQDEYMNKSVNRGRGSAQQQFYPGGTRELIFNGTSVKVDGEFWEDDEEDCGNDYTYNNCDEGHLSDFHWYFDFKDIPSGTPHVEEKVFAWAKFQFEVIWYPAPFVSDYTYKQYTFEGGYPGMDPDAAFLELWPSKPTQALPILSNDDIRGGICAPFIRTLRSPRPASVDNNAKNYFEYYVTSTNSWKSFAGYEDGTFSQEITVDLGKALYDELKIEGSLHAQFNIRIYRKSPTGNLIEEVNDYDYQEIGPAGFPWEPQDYLFRRKYQQNIASLSRRLYPPPPTFAIDTLIGTAPRCNLESNGYLTIPYLNIQGNAMGHYQFSLRNCWNGSIFCPDCYTDSIPPSFCAIGAGTKRTGSTDETLNGLETGSYVLQITDILHVDFAPNVIGCSNLYPVIIPNKPPIIVTAIDTIYTNTNVRCFDTSDGIVTLNISGGNPPYKTSHTDSTGGTWQTVVGTTYRILNLAPGEHTFFAGDSRDCPVAFVYDTLSKPDTLRLFLREKKRYVEDAAEPGFRHVSCYHASDGEFTVQARSDNGAAYVNPNFNYWITGTNSQGQAYSSDTLNANSTNISGTDAATIFSNLSAGQYTIHLKDNNSCYFADTFTLREPTPLTLTNAESIDNLCANQKKGTIKVLADGATQPYYFYKDSYDPYPASSYRICVEDKFDTETKACNVNAHTTGKTFDKITFYTNLPSHAHIAYVKDTNGCITPLSFSINEPLPILPDVDYTYIQCKGEANGALHASASGGVEPYQFSWSLNNASAFTSSPDATNLSAGDYYLKIIDANNCINNSGSYELKETKNPLTATVKVTAPVSCAEKSDAEIEVIAVGGGIDYQYSLDGVQWQRNNKFNHLAAGQYSVFVKDHLGCHIEVQAPEINKPNVFTANITNTPTVSCYGFSDATVSVELEGGTSPYFRNVNGEWLQIPSSSIISGASAGNVNLLLKDSHNCSFTKTISVSGPARLEASVVSKSDASLGNNDGKATIEANGGVSPYIYQWPSGSQGPLSGASTEQNLEAGYTNLIVVDNNGCTINYQVGINTIGGPSEITASTVLTAPLCHESDDGGISVEYSGVDPITYQWIQKGISGPQLTSIEAGEWLLKVTDGNGAITTASYQLTSPEELFVQSSSSSLICYNACQAEIRLRVSGGTGSYSVLWSNGSATATISNLCAGLYSYVVKDAHQCSTSGDVEISNPLPVIVDLGPDQVLCSGQTLGLDAGHDGSTYVWNTGETSRTLLTKEAGDHIVKVTTPDGCIGTDTMNIELSDKLLAAVYYISTKIYAGSTLVFVDATWPQPDFVEWNFGDSCIVVNDEDMYLPQIMYPYPGVFEVSMIAHLGECSDTLYKVVKVYAPEDSTGFNNGRAVSGIESLKVFPNPTQSSINAEVDLFGQDAITWHLVDGHGNIVREFSQDGQQHYQITMQAATLPRGLYILRVSSSSSSKYVVVTLE